MAFVFRKKIIRPLSVSFFLFIAHFSFSQKVFDSLLAEPDLSNIIQYALKRQPLVQQSLADERITELQIRSRLADWYPQVNFNYIYQHNFQVQTSVIGGNTIKLGVNNTSAFQFGATQNIFDRDVLLAFRTKGIVLKQSQQQTENIKIDLVSNISKAFYSILASIQQIKIANEAIVRLEKSLKDAKARYDAGIVDKTDYKRATIALNNAIATKKSAEAELSARTEYLRSLMNYPETASLNIQYDSLTLEREVYLDTLQGVDYSKRIEYRLLETQRRLQEANLKYNQWAFIPSISANGAYNLNFLNNSFSKLYSQSFPNSYAGLTLSFPIFQGGKRRYNIEIAQWEVKRIDYTIENLKNTINAEYSTALASYKSSLADYLAMRENVGLAQEVYDVIQLQYRSGIKTYLEVITAETDLRTAQINYYNSLFQLISNKIDVLKAKGEINY